MGEQKHMLFPESTFDIEVPHVEREGSVRIHLFERVGDSEWYLHADEGFFAAVMERVVSAAGDSLKVMPDPCLPRDAKFPTRHPLTLNHEPIWRLTDEGEKRWFRSLITADTQEH